MNEKQERVEIRLIMLFAAIMVSVVVGCSAHIQKESPDMIPKPISSIDQLRLNIGKQVTLNGIAEGGRKIGPVIRCDGFVVVINGLSWPPEVIGKRIEVVGLLSAERVVVDVTDPVPSAHAGSPGDTIYELSNVTFLIFKP